MSAVLGICCTFTELLDTVEDIYIAKALTRSCGSTDESGYFLFAYATISLGMTDSKKHFRSMLIEDGRQYRVPVYLCSGLDC